MEGFRQSYVKTLLAHPPAALKHQLDNGSDPTECMVRGSLFDALLFGSSLSRFAFSEFDSFRSKAAQEWRDDQQAAGLEVVTKESLSVASEAANRIRDDIFDALGLAISTSDLGSTTQVKIPWYHGVIPCVSTLDILEREPPVITDVKFTTVPLLDGRAIESHVLKMWSHQAWAYREAVRYSFGLDCRFQFLLCSQSAPNCWRIVVPDEEILEYGRRRFDRAAKIWHQCVGSGSWPKSAPALTATCPRWAKDEE